MAEPQQAIDINPAAWIKEYDPRLLRGAPRDRIDRFAMLLRERQKRQAQRQFFNLFPEETTEVDGLTIHSRLLYPRHMEFFLAGAVYRERCFMAANRVGKTVAGAYECTCHLTGLYPAWWEGRRFNEPIRCWAAGKTDETTRDIVQQAMFGDIVFENGRKALSGKGMVPGYLIGRPNWKRGTDDLLDTILIKHVSGGWSKLGLKSYKQGRGAFEGTSQHVIWLDEECPMDVYGECLVRTATVNGLMMITFTPLEGLTDTVMQFMLGMGNQLANL